MYGTSNMETYITICEIDSEREFAVYVSGNSNRGCVSTWRGGMGGRGDGVSNGRGYMYTYG